MSLLSVSALLASGSGNLKLDKYGYLAGEETTDILGGADAWRTPGINYGRSGLDAVQAEMDAIFSGAPDKRATGVETANTRAADKANERANSPGFWENLFARGSYLIVGVIFLIIGLVMLSRPVQREIAASVQGAISK